MDTFQNSEVTLEMKYSGYGDAVPHIDFLSNLLHRENTLESPGDDEMTQIHSWSYKKHSALNT